jgi:transforming growth factor-beta-induced protein
MEQTGLGPAIDVTQNVTCLIPTDDAFLSAGTSSDNITTLGSTLSLHVLKEPVYTSFLSDGDEYETIDNQKVRVSILNGDIYFNDALLTKPNVLTNNGVMHVIDRVMSPLSTSPASSSTAGSSTSVASSTASVPATTTTTASPTSATGSATSATQSGEARLGRQFQWTSVLLPALGAFLL